MNARNRKHTSSSQTTGKTDNYISLLRSWTPIKEIISHKRFACAQCPLYQPGIGCQRLRNVLVGREVASCMFVATMSRGGAIGKELYDQPYELAVDNLNLNDPN